MPIRIRSATERDLNVLVLLNDAVQQLHSQLCPDDFKSKPTPSEIKTFFEKGIKENNTYIFIAEIEQKPIGYTVFEICDRPESPFRPARKYIYIHQISVNSNAHSKGVGTALLRYVEEQAMAQGIAEIELDTWAANQKARQFFEAQGFEVFNLVLRRFMNGR